MTRRYELEEVAELDTRVRSFSLIVENFARHIEHLAVAVVALWFVLNALAVVGVAEWRFGSLLGHGRWSGTLICLLLLAVTLVYVLVLAVVRRRRARPGG